MQYLLDTVTVVRHFSAMGKIGEEARKILNSSESSFIISVISLMEIMYLAEKKRIAISLRDTFAQIESSSLYSTIDLTPEILKTAEVTAFGELHDRLILSTAKWLEIPIISSDKGFQGIEGIQVVWN
ncbi:PIN domain protein [delta proteobacterium NaphS2]|nr:PIN domain protein [delta proteobacterium NaphS2]